MTARAWRTALRLLPFVALAACDGAEEAAVISRPPVAVTAVEARDIVDRILVTGELIAVNEASVAAEVDGRVTSILVEEGAAVEKGETVFEIDTERRQLELDDARAQVEEALAHREQQERETLRWRRLHEGKTASQAQLDQAEAELRLARSRLTATRARLGLAERALRNASVAAPFAGIVSRRRASEGEFITAGTDLFDLVSVEPIEVEFQVTERDSGRVELGQWLDVHVAPYPDRVFRAEVTMVSPQIDPRSRTLRVKARVQDPERLLRPGLFARADLGVSERAGVPVIPEGAILQRSDGSVVFRMLGPDQVERVVLSTGAIRDGYVEVVGGLAVGDVIVVRGHAQLVDGSRVDVRSQAGKPTVAAAPRDGRTPE